ncbi:hypothetical protein Ancab_000776 [Ancistrocladus abbreviatus]
MNFWIDSWAYGLGALHAYRRNPNCEFMKDEKVASFRTTDGGWDWAQSKDLLKDEAIRCIAGIHPPDTEGGSDEIRWPFETSGEFPLKSAYTLSTEDSWEQTATLWRIWKWLGPQCIRSFMCCALCSRYADLTVVVLSVFGFGWPCGAPDPSWCFFG